MEPDHAILFGLRLPRVILGALVGAALAAAGVALQALLRNPLAEPFVLGVSGGAALGGTAALAAAAAVGPASALGAVVGSGASVALGASVGAAASTALVFALGRIGGKLVPEAALLVGVVFNAFAAGVITVVKVMVPPEEAARLLYWLMGAVGLRRPRHAGHRRGLRGGGGGGARGRLGAAEPPLPGRRRGLLARRGRGALPRRWSSWPRAWPPARRWRWPAWWASSGSSCPTCSGASSARTTASSCRPRSSSAPPSWCWPTPRARLAFLPLGSEPPVGALTALLGGPLFLWLLRRTERSG